MCLFNLKNITHMQVMCKRSCCTYLKTPIGSKPATRRHMMQNIDRVLHLMNKDEMVKETISKTTVGSAIQVLLMCAYGILYMSFFVSRQPEDSSSMCTYENLHASIDYDEDS